MNLHYKKIAQRLSVKTVVVGLRLLFSNGSLLTCSRKYSLLLPFLTVVVLVLKWQSYHLKIVVIKFYYGSNIFKTVVVYICFTTVVFKW